MFIECFCLAFSTYGKIDLPQNIKNRESCERVQLLQLDMPLMDNICFVFQKTSYICVF